MQGIAAGPYIHSQTHEGYLQFWVHQYENKERKKGHQVRQGGENSEEKDLGEVSEVSCLAQPREKKADSVLIQWHYTLSSLYVCVNPS